METAMVPTEENYMNRIEMRAFTSRIYRTMLAGINGRKRGEAVWRSRPINEHMGMQAFTCLM